MLKGTAIKLTTVPLFVTVATSVTTFYYLVRLDVNVAPVIGWNQQLWIEEHAFDIRLEYLADLHLFHRQPCYIVDQLLLGGHVGL